MLRSKVFPPTELLPKLFRNKRLHVWCRSCSRGNSRRASMKHTAVAESRFFNAGNYFEPDVLVSFEYSKANRRRDHLIPEEKLMFAVLTDAIECFQKYVDGKSRRYRRLYNEAQTWIMNCDDRSVFSF